MPIGGRKTLVLLLALLLNPAATSNAQSGYGGSSWSPAYGGMGWAPGYGGFGWGRQFGMVGGPIVTTNGYLYPVYGPNGNGLSGFVNAMPVLGDWSQGYARYEPNRRAALAALGYGPEASWSYRSPLIYRVAAPPTRTITPAPSTPGSTETQIVRSQPQILDLGPQAVTVRASAAPPPARPAILRGSPPADPESIGPHILEIGRPASSQP
jgi:hypothetical protein